MKKMLLLLMLLVGYSTAAVAQQSSTGDVVFIVDGKKIPDFDGSILEGRKVLKYEVTVGKDAVKIHKITLEPQKKLRSADNKFSSTIFLLKGGKELTQSEMKKIDPATIKSITIFKKGDKKALTIDKRSKDADLCIIELKEN